LYDPYAFRFINPEILKFAAAHPAEAAAKLEEMEKHLPGLSNSIKARVRYFDEFIEKNCSDRLEQLVILGAGFDTRAYRLAGLKKNVRVFEVDHPDTLFFKMEKIREIFGDLPNHVVYVPIDFEFEDLGDKLRAHDYSPDQKTLFVLEGLTMYLPQKAVDETFEFIVHNAGMGSTILFDYFPASVVDGSSDREIAKNIWNFTQMIGEPLQFGIPDGEVVRTLTEYGFSGVWNVTSEEYKSMFFLGKNAGRQVCDLLAFVSAKVE
jgi:methyltransferase (TIGR00027 family)